MRVFPAAVYLLCAATSFCCLALLTRSYLCTRSRLLLWSALSFVGFAANNLLVFTDIPQMPGAVSGRVHPFGPVQPSNSGAGIAEGR